MKARSYRNIENLDPIAQNFVKCIADRMPKCVNVYGYPSIASSMTFCCPDFESKRHSYMTILSKIIANGGTMRRKDIIGSHRVYGEDINRGRAACTFQRIKAAKLVTSDSKGYHITEDGRRYVEVMKELAK